MVAVDGVEVADPDEVKMSVVSSSDRRGSGNTGAPLLCEVPRVGVLLWEPCAG